MMIIILPVIGLAVLSTLIVWSCCIIAAESDEREMELWDEYESEKMGKWDPVKRIYEPYTVPEDWHVPLFCADLDEQINCARCGKNMTYGDAYTSRQIQGVFGLGYPVCIECNEIEWQEESKAKHESYKG